MYDSPDCCSHLSSFPGPEHLYFRDLQMHSSCFVNRHVLRTKYIVACTESKGDAVEALAQKTVMCIVSSLISEDFHLCFLKLEVMVMGWIWQNQTDKHLSTNVRRMMGDGGRYGDISIGTGKAKAKGGYNDQ